MWGTASKPTRHTWYTRQRQTGRPRILANCHMHTEGDKLRKLEGPSLKDLKRAMDKRYLEMDLVSL